jgi:hypothetical protein
MEHDATEMRAVPDKARKQLWRLREALESGNVDRQVSVIREVVAKVAVQFTHTERSSKASGAAIYVRPGLSLSCLCLPERRIKVAQRPLAIQSLPGLTPERHTGAVGPQLRGRLGTSPPG